MFQSSGKIYSFYVILDTAPHLVMWHNASEDVE